MANNVNNSRATHESRPQLRDVLKNDPEDLNFLLPPYPEDLPDPLAEEDSMLASPMSRSLEADNEVSAITSMGISTLADVHYSGIQEELEPPGAHNGSILLNASDRDNRDYLNSAEGTQCVSFEDRMTSRDQEAIRTTSGFDIESKDDSHNVDKTQLGVISFPYISPQETTNAVQTQLDPKSLLQFEPNKSNDVSPIGAGPHSTTKQERSLESSPRPASLRHSREYSGQNEVLPHHQHPHGETLDPCVNNSNVGNELWPPVPDVAEIDINRAENLGELDKFCRDFSIDGNTPTSGNGNGDNGSKSKMISANEANYSSAQTSNYGMLPGQPSVERQVERSGNMGSAKVQSIDAELSVPRVPLDNEEQPFIPPSGNRDFSIPLNTSGHEHPEFPVQDMGQRRRDRFAQSKSPFWRESTDGNSGVHKAQTPMAFDSLGDTPYDARDPGEPRYVSQDAGLRDNGGSTSNNDAAVIGNDYIIIKLGGDGGGRKTDQKLAEIVQELKRLSSMDDINKRERRSDHGSSVESIPKSPSPGSMDYNGLFPRNDQRHRGKFATATSRVISDNAIPRSGGHFSNPGSIRRVRGGNKAPLRHGVSFQHDLVTRAASNGVANAHEKFATSSLDRLDTGSSPSHPNSGNLSRNVQSPIKPDARSVDQSPVSENDDAPVVKTNHRGGLYERFGFVKARPNSDEMPSTHKIMKFLNLTNGSGPDPDKISNGSPKQNGRPDNECNNSLQQQTEDQEKDFSSPSTAGGQTNDAFENESQFSGDDLVSELLRLSGKTAGGAMSVSSTIDSAEESETPDETTPLYSNQHRRQRSVAFFDNNQVSKERPVDFDSIYEEADETASLKRTSGLAEIVYTDENVTDDDIGQGDDFMNEEYDNLSLEFVVPGSKRHIRLHRQTFINFVLKYAIFLFSFMYWSLSLSAIGFGTWMLTRKTVVFDNASDVMLEPNVLLCMVSGIIFLVAFLGLLGALRQNILLLRLFHISLTAVLALEGFLTALIFVFYTLPEFRAAAKVGPEEILKKAVIRYFDDEAMRDWIDNLQKEFKCCGVSLRDNGYLDWTENQYFNCSTSNPSIYRCSVPLSCCIFEPGDYINYMCGIGIINKDISYVKRYINTKGCMKSFGEWLADNTSLIAYIGLAFFIPQLPVLSLGRWSIQILGVVAARFYIKNLRKIRDKAIDDQREDDDEEDSEDEDSPTNSAAADGVAATAATTATKSAAVAIPAATNDAQTGV